MRRRTCRITLGQNHAYVTGYGTRDMLTELRHGQPPVWSTIHRAWVSVPKTARNLVALAESRGYDVEVTAEGADPGGGRW